MLKLSTESDDAKTPVTVTTHIDPKSKHHRARLNVFQRLIRQWESLHPYNGAQVLKIKGAVDINLCRKAWFDALEFLNLGVVGISAGSYHHRRMNGEAQYHGVVLCPEGTKLDTWISDELNRPFVGDESVPFRPFAIQEDGHFWMGLCYQHWVADSASIRMLIHEWFVRQYDPARASGRPARFSSGGYLTLFGPQRKGPDPMEILLSTLRWQSHFKKMRRIEDREKFQEMSLRFMLLDTPNDLIEPLRRAARNFGVTVNDIFLATIAQVCDRCVPAQHCWRRQQLAIGTIVDLRSSSRRPLDDVFDLLLGFTCVSCQADDFKRWPDLIESVARQTRRLKSGGLPLGSCLRMFLGVVVGKYFSREAVVEFYRKRVPLAGANSNVNLNRCWAGKYADNPILEYVRVAPTGPMTPLVFATTTVGNHLSVGLTHRTGIIPPEQAQIIGRQFITRLREIADAATNSKPL
jgi:hypothetical protein